MDLLFKASDIVCGKIIEKGRVFVETETNILPFKPAFFLGCSRIIVCRDRCTPCDNLGWGFWRTLHIDPRKNLVIAFAFCDIRLKIIAFDALETKKLLVERTVEMILAVLT